VVLAPSDLVEHDQDPRNTRRLLVERATRPGSTRRGSSTANALALWFLFRHWTHYGLLVIGPASRHVCQRAFLDASHHPLLMSHDEDNDSILLMRGRRHPYDSKCCGLHLPASQAVIGGGRDLIIRVHPKEIWKRRTPKNEEGR
jgi:hypothetical protein